MYKPFFVIIILGSFALFIFGVFNIFLEVEDNTCRMTYMFGQPQFARIRVDGNAAFPNYALYYYHEGNAVKDGNAINYNGAPVLFIPGNGGSHKQARSLASVALRKSMDMRNHIKLDYFTISYNEELSALYGGYLSNQKVFLKLCIDTILKLYHNRNAERTVVLIGHSMGGKIAEAVVTDERIARLVNTIIYIATPLDSPVLNLDVAVQRFYNDTNTYLARQRGPLEVTTNSNACNNFILAPYDDKGAYNWNKTSSLENILFISIGGGNRDLLVRAGLTTSRFSDIHAMTTSIPNVWLSCDHLSSVWCLQLMLVVNRFLFSISYRDESQAHVLFKASKGNRLHSAVHYFVKNKYRQKIQEVDFVKSDADNVWYEDSKKVFQRHLKSTASKTYNQMISLTKFNKFTKLYLEVLNFDDDDWLYGCAAQYKPDGQSYCEKGAALSQYIQRAPARDYNVRSFVLIDLQKVRNKFSKWSHVVVRLPSTNKPLTLHADIHDPAERVVATKAPRWFSFNKVLIFNETSQGTLYYKIEISELEEPFQGIKFNVETIACIGKTYNILVKICVPWASGFVRYHKINENSNSNSVYVNVPLAIPSGYNTTVNPVSVEVYLDPRCRYSISYQFSIVNTMSKLVLEYCHWLPCHLVAVLLIVLKNQLKRFHSSDDCKDLKPYKEYFQCSSIYILTGCRIFKKLLIPVKALPAVDTLNTSFFVSLTVHSAAICISILLAFAFWLLLVCNGNVFFKVLSRFFKFSLEPSSVLVHVISALPASFGVLAVAIAMASCGGIALILATTVYFLMISNAYKDYLEHLFWKKSTEFVKKTFSKGDKVENSHEEIAKEPADRDMQCEGLQNFQYHITMFMLLFIMSALNGPSAMAWFKNYRQNELSLADPSLVPIVIVLIALTLLLQVKAPNKLCGHRCLSVILYACASACVIYCQEAIYRINWLIAFAYALIAAIELVNQVWIRCQRVP